MHQSTTNALNATGGGGVQPIIKEYSIRVPKSSKNKHHVMRFNYNLNVDFSQWRNIKLERENNLKEFKSAEEETPRFGAGSEYNREQKEEARRKKFGIIAKKYNPDAQPWILKVNGKKFRGVREGGVSENAAHYIFTQTKDGSIEAYPLQEWYNFQPIQRYKAMTAEEAEEEFGRRRKCVNLWSMKMRMKLKNKDDEEPEDPEETKAAKGSKGGDKKKLQISEMDEWMDSDDMSSSGDDEEKKKEDEDSDNESKAKKKQTKNKLEAANKKKKKRDVDDEAFEESDDGDEEGREKDYISDSSDSESEPENKANKELKSVAEEDALRKLLTSDEDSDEEKSNKAEDNDSEDEKDRKADDGPKESVKEKTAVSKEKKKEDKKSRMAKINDMLNNGPGTANASDFSSDSDDSEMPEKAVVTKQKKKKNKNKGGSGQNSRSGTPSLDAASGSGLKRKGSDMINVSDNSNSPATTPAKKMKTDSAAIAAANFANYNSTSKDSSGITEEAVRRYLMRKPMTATELLKKFQSKKTGVSRDELVDVMTGILKKINPHKEKIQGKMYLSIKTPK